jgi:hypothetical protein
LVDGLNRNNSTVSDPIRNFYVSGIPETWSCTTEEFKAFQGSTAVFSSTCGRFPVGISLIVTSRIPLDQRGLPRIGALYDPGETAHNGETLPLLEIRLMKGGACLEIRRLIRGSAFTKAVAISVPWSWLEVSTKALTLDDVSAARSVTR